MSVGAGAGTGPVGASAPAVVPVAPGDGLEVRVGQGRMIVPMAAVAQVGRYRVGGKLPGAARHVAGIGAWEDQLVVSLSLVPLEAVVDREATGILLETRHRTPMRWALEIVAPVGIIRVTKLVAAPAAASSRRPAWLLNATTSDNRTMLWVEVDGMIAAAGEAGSR